jgi:curved DNA-binding protein CbpA
VASLYNVLKVAPDAPIEVIRAAYRVLAARYHPDRCGPNPEALSRMQRVNEAYRVLSDPGLRAKHDAVLSSQRRRRASDGASDTAAKARPDAAAPSDLAAMLRQRAAAAYAAHRGHRGPSAIRARS